MIVNKKHWPILLAIVVSASAAACGGGNSSSDAADAPEAGDLEHEEGDAAGEPLEDAAQDDGAAEIEPDPDPEPDLPLEIEDIVEDAGEEETPAVFYPPENWGPFSVGVRTMRHHSSEMDKTIEIKIWYPAVDPPPGATPATYLLLMKGNAYEDLAVNPASPPYPLILFSHGNKGVNFQSYSLTEHLASHGFFVAAPNHPGNTMFDSPSDEQMAVIALERPQDIAFAYEKIMEAVYASGDPFYLQVDSARVGIAGHSFGGYTTVVISGASVDVDAAAARCDAGSESDIFCPYISFWPAGETIRRPDSMSIVKAALALAPGGYAAFGDEGLGDVDMPVMIFGGTLDEWTPLETEIRPIYDGIEEDAWKIEITQAGHMSFTDICRLPVASLIPELADMCDPEVYIDIDSAFYITNTFSTAYFRFYLFEEDEMEVYLTEEYGATFPQIDFQLK
ncbi:MAG: dienelactone hydrolase family protein [Pseudomonadota bacterium]